MAILVILIFSFCNTLQNNRTQIGSAAIITYTLSETLSIIQYFIFQLNESEKGGR